jgi:hypothetical protein
MPIIITSIVSATLITAICLTRKTSMEITINFGENKLVSIKGNQPILLPQPKTNDCPP